MGKGLLSRMVSALMPWAPRSERRAAVEAARLSADRSAEQAEESRDLDADLQDVFAENHLAQIMFSNITGQQFRRGD